MEYTLTVTGSREEILDLLGGTAITSGNVEVTPVAEPPVQEAPQVEPQPTPAAETPVAAEDVGQELDSRGFPWDSEIHASTKSKTKDGAWTYKRGVPQVTKDRVEARLRPDLAGAPAQAEQPAATGTVPLPPGTMAPEEPAPVPTPADPQPAPQVGAITYQGVMQLYAVALQNQTITVEGFGAILAEVGLTNPAELVDNAGALTHVHARLTANG